MKKSQAELSELDKAILRIIQEDSNTKLEAIADQVGASGATVAASFATLSGDGNR